MNRDISVHVMCMYPWEAEDWDEVHVGETIL